MSDSVTIEEAKLCWQCNKPGREHINQPAANGNGRVYTFICMNEVCPNYDSGWIVQVRADGTIPVRDKGNINKQFQPLTNAQESMAQRMIDEAKRDDN